MLRILKSFLFFCITIAALSAQPILPSNQPTAATIPQLRIITPLQNYFNQPVTLSILLRADTPLPPTGVVVLTDASQPICSLTLPKLSCVTTELPLGKSVIKAVYSGDSRYIGVSAQTTIVVQGVLSSPIATSALLYSPVISPLPIPIPYGTPLEVTISPTPTPPTTTSFVVYNTNNNQVLCSSTLDPSGALQPCLLPNLPVDTYTLKVVLINPGNPSTTLNPLNFTVGKATATPILAASYSTSHGNPVAITVRGLPLSATGFVSITSNNEPICSFTLPATSCNTPLDLNSGTYSLEASYDGDSNFNPSTSEISPLSVLTGTYMPSLSYAQVSLGDSVKEFHLNSVPPYTYGTITISSPNYIWCTIALPVLSCFAQSPVAPGYYPLTAVYSGDPNTAPATVILSPIFISSPSSAVQSSAQTASSTPLVQQVPQTTSTFTRTSTSTSVISTNIKSTSRFFSWRFHPAYNVSAAVDPVAASPSPSYFVVEIMILAFAVLTTLGYYLFYFFKRKKQN